MDLSQQPAKSRGHVVEGALAKQVNGAAGPRNVWVVTPVFDQQGFASGRYIQRAIRRRRYHAAYIKHQASRNARAFSDIDGVGIICEQRKNFAWQMDGRAIAVARLG